MEHAKYSLVGFVFTILNVSWEDVEQAFLLGFVGAGGALTLRLLWDLLKWAIKKLRK